MFGFCWETIGRSLYCYASAFGANEVETLRAFCAEYNICNVLIGSSCSGDWQPGLAMQQVKINICALSTACQRQTKKWT